MAIVLGQRKVKDLASFEDYAIGIKKFVINKEKRKNNATKYW